ncbi:hypothetical protein C943_03892 [Mariniradius saccharolyticus AK6]|uniref:Uncharacterized protein n=1 Tax=Mariniradius saccharolyticus AK6 TaxID=1239962 RepID=M7YA70_9BACT|nr:hypothetical protein C943_03892 [Mariniradius saccharolyticus AK6]
MKGKVYFPSDFAYTHVFRPTWMGHHIKECANTVFTGLGKDFHYSDNFIRNKKQFFRRTKCAAIF